MPDTMLQETTRVTANQPRAVILSREELLVILSITGRTFPELSTEPIADLTDAQRAYGLIVAERALRARGLARLDAEGTLRFDHEMLRLVLGCTTNGAKLFLTRVRSTLPGVGVELSAHHYDGQWLLHHQPSGGMHAFQHGGSWERAWPSLASFLDYPTEGAASSLSLVVSGDTLARAREAAERGESDGAATLLSDAGADGDAASLLAALLARPHAVTTIQAVRPLGEDVALQAITTLHDEDTLLVAVSPEGEEGLTIVQGATIETIHDSIVQMLTVPLG